MIQYGPRSLTQSLSQILHTPTIMSLCRQPYSCKHNGSLVGKMITLMFILSVLIMTYAVFLIVSFFLFIAILSRHRKWWKPWRQKFREKGIVRGGHKWRVELWVYCIVNATKSVMFLLWLYSFSADLAGCAFLQTASRQTWRMLRFMWNEEQSSSRELPTTKWVCSSHSGLYFGVTGLVSWSLTVRHSGRRGAVEVGDPAGCCNLVQVESLSHICSVIFWSQILLYMFCSSVSFISYLVCNFIVHVHLWFHHI